MPLAGVYGQETRGTNRAVYYAARHDNDMWNVPIGSDRYYSSGLFGSRTVVEQPTAHLFSDALLQRGRFREIRGWQVTQRIYTPAVLTEERLQPDDRPFAAFATLTRQRGIASPGGGFIVRSDWQFGILGKYAAGELVQNTWHRMIPFAEEVMGWQHQVKPDLVINYNPSLRLRILGGSKMRAYFGTAVRLGTLFTDIQPDVRVEVEPLGPTQQVALVVFGELRGRFTAYDATLRGGLLNRDARYRNRFEPNAVRGLLDLGGHLSWGRFFLEAGVRHATREAAGFGLHGYGYFALRWRFD